MAFGRTNGREKDQPALKIKIVAKANPVGKMLKSEELFTKKDSPRRGYPIEAER
jgi:hypothetical protein